MPSHSAHESTNALIFIAGVGAPVDAYTHLIKRLQESIPHQSFHLLEWWSQDDFGEKALSKFVADGDAILVGHSSGGSMAIEALVQSPDKIKKVIMLDSHRLQSMSPFPPVEKMLEIMLGQDSPEIKRLVEQTYAPIILNSAVFLKAVNYLSQWVKNDFERVAAAIQKMPAHTVLHVGFTDNHYQILDATHEKEQEALWGKYNIDVECLPMTHFDLLSADKTDIIMKLLISWLQ